MLRQYQTIRLVIAGIIKVNQTWSIGITISSPKSPGNAPLTTWLEGVQSLVTDWWGHSNGPGFINSSDTAITALRAYVYAPGVRAAVVQAEKLYAAPLAGGSSQWMPTQTSLVCSLLTGLPGRHFRGRLYVPATGVQLNAGHLVDSGYVTGVATATADLLTALNGTSLAGGSVRTMVPSNRDFPQPITAVRVDNEVDIQRRRADKLAGTLQITRDVE